MRRLPLLIWILLLTCVISVVVASLIYHTKSGLSAEYATSDIRLRIRSDYAVDRRIVIVGIDEATQKRWRAEGRSIDQSRASLAEYTKLIKRLSQSGAVAIGIDQRIVRGSTNNLNREFLEETRKANNVVVAIPPRPSIGVIELEKPLSQFVDVQDDDALTYGRIHYGASDVFPDSNGTVRWVRTKIQYPENKTSVTSFYKQAIIASGFAMESSNEHDRHIINYPGIQSVVGYSPYDQHNFIDVVRNDSSTEWARGKIILVGYTGQLFRDVFATPMGPSVPGVQIHAIAVDNALHDRWLRSYSKVVSWLITVSFALFMIVTYWIRDQRLVVLCGVTLVIAYLILAQYLFESANIVLPVLGPVVAAFLAIVVQVFMRARRDQLERSKVESVFSRYVSPGVLKELLVPDVEVDLQGSHAFVTILFSDIRSFTTQAEGAVPEDIVAQLNEYFSEMVSAAELHRGTIDKFIGDGMMVVFGAPLADEQHAANACRTAVEMMNRLKKLNQVRSERNQSPFAIGIGIHSGSVIIGNVGAPGKRVDYTAIGDAVNIAARLSDNFGDGESHILVSSETWQIAKSNIDSEAIDAGLLPVRGRLGDVACIELLP